MNKTELQKERDRINEQLDEIRTKEYEALNAKDVGKYFRYRNCYSCPSKSEDYWWLYMKVLSVSGGCLEVFKFQKDC